jgi:hypothetical protein
VLIEDRSLLIRTAEPRPNGSDRIRMLSSTEPIPIVVEQTTSSFHLAPALLNESRGLDAGTEDGLLEVVEVFVRRGLEFDQAHVRPLVKGVS